MNIMYSLYKPWCDKVFSGEKTLEFRTKIPKELKKGSKIYFYETKKYNGSGKVVGECTVTDIIPVLSKNGKWPTYGCYPFMEYYFENIIGDFEFADYIRQIKEDFDGKFDNYKYGYIINYMMSEENLENIRKTGHPIDTWKLFDKPLIYKILDDIDMANEFIHMCDDWLMDIGFYNDMCESYYKWGIAFSEVVKYETPISVDSFLDKNGKHLKTGPQSFCYAQKRYK